GLREATPDPAAKESPPRPPAGRGVEAARRSGRTLLREDECRALLAAYGLSTAGASPAGSEAEALERAEAAGYPVVVTAQPGCPSLGPAPPGVRLFAADPPAVRRAFRALGRAAEECGCGGPHFAVAVRPAAGPGGYELLLSSVTDAQLGPVL